MKKLLLCLLCAALLLCAAGCVKPDPQIQDPVSFYYCRSELKYGNDGGVIQEEVRDAGGSSGDYSQMVSLYLKGPENSSLYRPFPTATHLVSLTVENDTVFLELSHSFSSLSGLELTLSCACLTLTACGLTGAKQCTVFVSNTLLDGNSAITMSCDSILLLDDSNIVIDPE